MHCSWIIPLALAFAGASAASDATATSNTGEDIIGTTRTQQHFASSVTNAPPQSHQEHPTTTASSSPSRLDVSSTVHLWRICSPGRSTSYNDKYDFPCNAVHAINEQCELGPISVADRETRQEFGTVYQQSADLQRACRCESQLLDMMLGCAACLKAHGGTGNELHTYTNSNETALRHAMQSYCDVSYRPTFNRWEDLMREVSAAGGVDSFPSRGGHSSSTSSTQASPSSSKPWSDPLTGTYHVSAYFTPSVTGSDAYVVGMPTASSSANQVHNNAFFTYTTLRTSDGQIIPTAGAEATEQTTEQATSSATSAASSNETAFSGEPTTSSDSGGVPTGSIKARLGAGALGFAALMGLL